MDTFPGAPFLVSAAAMLVASIVNFYLYTQRHRMRSHQVDDSSSLSKNDSSSNGSTIFLMLIIDSILILCSSSRNNINFTLKEENKKK